MPTHISDDIEIAVMRTLCKRFKSGMSVLAIDAIAKGPKAYLSLDIDPGAYKDAGAFSRDYLIYSFLRKWKGWESGADCERAAIDSWTAAERKNYHSNLRLCDVGSLNTSELRFISKVQLKISRVLGTEPSFEVIDRLCKWGPGATFDIRRSDDLDTASKMLSDLTVTKRCAAHFQRVMDPVWNSVATMSPSEVRGNRCVTVPKNAKTDRMIAAEPTANSFLQQGVGRFIRNRLKAFGVDLNDQSVNQELAFRAEVDELSTLDLSMASDTLCIEAVRLLLPPSWFDLLDDLRSPYSYLNGSWYRLEKFSSMGNAFTFELETLIFWALASVYCEELPYPVSVYGDDIILPRAKARGFVKVLAYFGFSVNVDKSYVEVHFFESCGKHYHSLEDVTPAYQKEIVKTDLPELIRIHNRLYRWGLRNGLHYVKDALKVVIDFTIRSHPKLKHIPRIPNGPSDRGFITATEDLVRNRNGDFVCTVLEEVNVNVYLHFDREQVATYAYKLRSPATLNGSPEGLPTILAEQRTRLRKRVVWASSCELS